MLVGLITTFLLEVRPFESARPYRLQVSLHSDTAGRARLTWHLVNGTSPSLFPADWNDVSKNDQMLSFNLPDTDVGTFRLNKSPKDAIDMFRLEPLDREGQVEIRNAALIGPQNETVATFPTSAFSAEWNSGDRTKTDGKSAVFRCGPDKGVVLFPRSPIALSRITVRIRPAYAAVQFVLAALTTMVVLLVAKRVPADTRSHLGKLLARARDAQAAWPIATLLTAAALGTAVSCSPVIFHGKTFISPNFGPTPTLYSEFPSSPLSPHETPESNRGSDTGATMWAHMQYSVIQHRAIFNHGELPLWNRYTQCGSPLLGQGISMLGDPLHWIPIAAGGATWAWDVKYCIAKLIFALGTGLLIFHATQRIWLATLLTVSCCFIGYFSYRFNHAAYFSLCYAPWILLCWLRAALTQGRVWPSMLALAGANFWELNSGTAKEAAMLIAGLNFTGCLLVLCADGKWRNRLAKIALMNMGNLLFVLLSAPHWMLFLDALRQSFTYFGTSVAFQIQPSLVLGLFDDLFYSQIAHNEAIINPGTNFLVLLGCLWAAVDLRRLLGNRIFVAVLLGAALPAAIVFGVIPPELLTRLPFIRNINHVDDTFAPLLIIHLLLIAAFGLHSLWRLAARRQAPRDALIAALLMTILIALFVGYTHAVMRPESTDYSPLRVTSISTEISGIMVKMSGFFRVYATALIAAVLAMPWVVRRIRLKPSTSSLIIGGLCLFVFHFRHGLWTGTKFDDYVSNPRTRSDLAAAPRAVRTIHAWMDQTGEPARVMGINNVLVPGFNTVLGLEHAGGPDALVNRWQHDLATNCGFGPAPTWMWWPMRGNFPQALIFGDLWNIRWYLGSPRELPREVRGLDLVADLELDVYGSPTAWPRAFFSDHLAECSSLNNFITLLRGANGQPFAAVVPENPSETPPAKPEVLYGRTIMPASNYCLTENSVSFTIDAPTPGVAVLGNSFEEGNWRVTLDGRSVDYFRVNHAFLGVTLSEGGIHKLRFAYWPRLLTPALWLALAGLLGVALTLLLGTFARRPTPTE